MTQKEENIGRVSEKRNHENELISSSMNISNGMAEMFINGLCDDGFDESSVSSKIAQLATINGVGNI